MDYIRELRALVGHGPLLVPIAARAWGAGRGRAGLALATFALDALPDDLLEIAGRILASYRVATGPAG